MDPGFLEGIRFFVISDIYRIITDIADMHADKARTALKPIRPVLL